MRQHRAARLLGGFGGNAVVPLALHILFFWRCYAVSTEKRYNFSHAQLDAVADDFF